MGVKNFSAEDLNAANLEALLNELRTKVNNKEYVDIRTFARDFASKIQGMTIGVSPDGKRTIEVRSIAVDPTTGNPVQTTEKVDLNNVVEKVLRVIEQSNAQTLTPFQKAQKDAMYVEVDKQLTALFKQKEMMEQLARNGFKVEDFVEKANKSNTVSDTRINGYKSEIQKVENTVKKVLGEDFIDPDPIFCRKSLRTKLQDEIDGKAHLENIERSLVTIKDLEDAITVMENEITADPTLESRYSGNIDANLEQIAQLSRNIEGAVTDLEKLNLPRFNLSNIKKCHDKSAMSRENAIQEVEKLLHGCILTGPLGIRRIPRSPDYTRGMDKRILEAYNMIRISIRSKDNASYTAVMDGISSGDPTKIEQAKSAIDAYMRGLDKKIEDYEREISKEEILKVGRNKSVAEFQKVVDRKNELEAKFDTVREQGKNDSGELLFLEDDGVTLTTTDTGTPYMVDKLVPKAATRTDYLSDFDETAKRDAIETAGRQRINDMSWREKRQLLKSAGVGNWLTRLLPGRLIRNQMATLLPTATRTELDQLDIDKQAHIDGKVQAEITEYERRKHQISVVEQGYAGILRSAPIQQRMQDAAYDAVQQRVNKPTGIIKGMQAASYEEVALLLATNFLQGDDLEAFNKARETYDRKAVVERNAPKRGIGSRTNPTTPVHEDETR